MASSTINNVTATTAASEPIVEAAPDFEAAIAKLQTIVKDAREMQTTLKLIQKAYAKACKGKKGKKTGVRKQGTPSGFVKPAALSDELSTFLGLPQGAELPRTEVTKKLSEYIKANNLQNPTDRRTILPDAKLKALLKPTEDAKVTYFNLQTYLKPHFQKAAVVV